MANAYISEHSHKGDEARGMPVEAPTQPAVATQKVSFTTTAGASSAFGTGTHFVRIITDAACHVAFGADPTATTNDPVLPANVIEYHHVRPGLKASFKATA